MSVAPLPINLEVMNLWVSSNWGSWNSQDHWGFCLPTFHGGYNKDLERRESFIVEAGKNV